MTQDTQNIVTILISGIVVVAGAVGVLAAYIKNQNKSQKEQNKVHEEKLELIYKANQVVLLEQQNKHMAEVNDMFRQHMQQGDRFADAMMRNATGLEKLSASIDKVVMINDIYKQLIGKTQSA